MNYSEKLRDPQWQKMRLIIMQRDAWACKSCGASTKTLNVHHKEYIKGRDPWDYPLNNFITLCEPCHEKEHDITDQAIAIASAEQRVMWRLVDKEDPPVIQSINKQIEDLTKELSVKHDDETETDILKNIMFLKTKKKELLTK